MGKKLELKGMRFGNLIVISQRGLNRGNKAIWLCSCDCGNFTILTSYSLARRGTKSCGCLRSRLITKKNTKHGHSIPGNHSVEFRAWQNIKNRCNNQKNSHYKWYGGKGVKICDRWLNNFSNFLSDMGLKPSTSHSIDRIDNNGNYEPSNCRWATPKEQSRNTSTNKFLTDGTKTMIMSDWAAELNCTCSQIKYFLDKKKDMAYIINRFKYERKSRRNIKRGL